MLKRPHPLCPASQRSLTGSPANKCCRQKPLGHPRENPRCDTFPPRSRLHFGPPGPKCRANLTAEDFPRHGPRPSHSAGQVLPALKCSAALQVRPPRHHLCAPGLAVSDCDHVSVPQPQAGSLNGLPTSPYALSAQPAPSSQSCSKCTPCSKGLRPEPALAPSDDRPLLHCSSMRAHHVAARHVRPPVVHHLGRDGRRLGRREVSVPLALPRPPSARRLHPHSKHRCLCR